MACFLRIFWNASKKMLSLRNHQIILLAMNNKNNFCLEQMMLQNLGNQFYWNIFYRHAANAYISMSYDTKIMTSYITYHHVTSYIIALTPHIIISRIFIEATNIICSHRSNMCCQRDCVSRHNGGTSGAPLNPSESIVLSEHYRVWGV